MGPSSEKRSLEIVLRSESVGYVVIDGRATPVYRALLADPAYPSGKMHETIVPLAAAE